MHRNRIENKRPKRQSLYTIKKLWNLRSLPNDHRPGGSWQPVDYRRGHSPVWWEQCDLTTTPHENQTKDCYLIWWRDRLWLLTAGYEVADRFQQEVNVAQDRHPPIGWESRSRPISGWRCRSARVAIGGGCLSMGRHSSHGAHSN